MRRRLRIRNEDEANETVDRSPAGQVANEENGGMISKQRVNQPREEMRSRTRERKEGQETSETRETKGRGMEHGQEDRNRGDDIDLQTEGTDLHPPAPCLVFGRMGYSAIYQLLQRSGLADSPLEPTPRAPWDYLIGRSCLFARPPGCKLPPLGMFLVSLLSTSF